MAYVDGFVVAVPTENKAEYIKHVEYCGEVFKEYGALKLVECWGNDVPDGEVTSFPMAVKCQPDETVCFSWLWWPSKEVRDQGMEKAMKDSRMTPENCPMPYDGKRMIFGGFDVIYDK